MNPQPRRRIWAWLGLVWEPNWRNIQARNVQPEGSVFDWCARSEDPQFLFPGRFILPGWYMLELTVHHQAPGAVGKLYVDYGAGFREEDSFSLPIKAGQLAKRLVYFARRPKRLRLDPLDHAGLFSIDNFCLVWVAPHFAYKRLVRRLSGVHIDWRGVSPEEILPRLRAQAREQKVPLPQWAMGRYEESFGRFRAGYDYQDWLACQPCPTREELERRLSALGVRDDFPKRETETNWEQDRGSGSPLVSVLLPVFDPDPAFLRQCLDSVLAQHYPDWEVCIADDCSRDPEVRAVLREYQQWDKRIRVAFRESNGHIAVASNTALAMAQGEFVALLDHDDLLHPEALLEVAEAVVANPEAQLLYSDEDKITPSVVSGERYDPHFKPDWNPDLVLAQNYVSHLGVYRRDRVLSIGGFRTGFEGSQDHDLVLRFTAGLPPSQIHHIPRVLYHWRATEGSTALSPEEKKYSAEAGLWAVRDRVAKMVPGATVEPGLVPHSYRVRWPLPQPAPLVSLIVPTRDGVEILRPCLEALLQRTDYPSFEVLVVDNGSRCPETLAYLEGLKEDPRIRILEWPHPFNYSAINNFAVGHAGGKVIGLINNDIEPINHDWLDEMARHACRSEIGCVGAKLYYPNDMVQHGGVILGIRGVAGHSHKYFPRSHPGYFSRLKLVQNLSAVTGACLLVRRSVFEEVGGLDETNLPVAFNDVDFCLRVREAGYRNLWTPYAEAYHHESVSRGGEDTPEKRRRADREIAYMRNRWGAELDNDPAYNPNLTLAHEDFSLR